MSTWTLFEEKVGLQGHTFSPAARLLDPETSQEAAAANPALRGNLRIEVLDVLSRHLAGLTDWELSEILHRHQPTVGKRRGELVDLGLVEFSGEFRLSPLGSRCRVWKAVNK
jgi:hypothetical protein